MAETVHFYLERMVPELEDLEQRGIFTKDEIKAIVKRRTALEYAVHRRIGRRADFLRYIEYEVNLDRLRRKRKARFGLDVKAKEGEKQMTISDYSITRRVHSLYQKALKKFPGDLSLWCQYYEWCQSAKSSKDLG
ncbi:U3 snoRNP protein [Blyttiomyces sp. JEL0837]|nr:U3 snoRNP protein [Blyttiomyces sp. JEL0837]